MQLAKPTLRNNFAYGKHITTDGGALGRDDSGWGRKSCAPRRTRCGLASRCEPIRQIRYSRTERIRGLFFLSATRRLDFLSSVDPHERLGTMNDEGALRPVGPMSSQVLPLSPPRLGSDPQHARSTRRAGAAAPIPQRGATLNGRENTDVNLYQTGTPDTPRATKSANGRGGCCTRHPRGVAVDESFPGRRADSGKPRLGPGVHPHLSRAGHKNRPKFRCRPDAEPRSSPRRAGVSSAGPRPLSRNLSSRLDQEPL